jgi:hypothetical protein
MMGSTILDREIQNEGSSISSLLITHPEACIWRDSADKPFNLCTTDPDAVTVVDGKPSHSQVVQRNHKKDELAYQRKLQVSLSLRLKGLFLYTVGILCNAEYCIR